MIAQVIDLNNNAPIKGERYFVDTNVWFWTTYVASKNMRLPDPPEHYQVSDYPRFLERALNDEARLFHCALMFAELANIIENKELEIYKNVNQKPHFARKAFRNIEKERKAVLNEIHVAWAAISKMSACIDITVDSGFIASAQNIMEKGRVDPFDSFYVQTMRKNNIDYIITDDHDFVSVSNQIVVTSNPKALRR